MAPITRSEEGCELLQAASTSSVASNRPRTFTESEDSYEAVASWARSFSAGA